MLTLTLIVVGIGYGIKRMKDWVTKNPLQSMDMAMWFKRFFVRR